jgi:hypothetical protein
MADPLLYVVSSCIDRSAIRHIELECNSSRPDLVRRRRTSLEIARTDKYGKTVRHEFLGDL